MTVLPPVEVVERYDNPLGVSDSASEGIVTGGGIRRRPALRPGEVLESIPGLIVTQHFGDGKANQVFARGYNLDHGTDFATWVAGMPVNMTSHAHGQGYTDLNFLIPELIERIDYSKGPYHARNGDFSSVGTARIAYLDRLPTSLASVSAGSFDFRRALLAGSPSVGPGVLLYALEHQAVDGPWELPQNLGKYNGVLRYAQGTAANGFNITGMAYGIALDFSAVWTRARFDDDDPAGDRIPGAPNKVASAGVTFEAPAGWSGALRWRYFGSRPLEESGTVKSKSTSLTNARIGYAFSPKVKLSMDVFNLFNRDDDISYFYVSRLPGEAADGVADIHFHPVEKRALRLTLSVAY